MRRLRPYVVLLVLIVALVQLGLSPPVAQADNSKDAHRVVVCVAVYHGEAFRAEEAVLDATNTKSERASIETMMIERWLLPEIAGKYHHEYYDYPNPVKSVTRDDLDRWACKWTEGNQPRDP